MMGYIHVNSVFHSLRPSDADKYQQDGSVWVKVMACRLFGAKPLPKQMLTLTNWR